MLCGFNATCFGSYTNHQADKTQKKNYYVNRMVNLRNPYQDVLLCSASVRSVQQQGLATLFTFTYAVLRRVDGRIKRETRNDDIMNIKDPAG